MIVVGAPSPLPDGIAALPLGTEELDDGCPLAGGGEWGGLVVAALSTRKSS